MIGLGKLGYPLASVLAKVYEVIGYDINQKRLIQLRDGLDTSEPDCKPGAIVFTTNPVYLEDCEFAMLCVNTPNLGREMDYTQIRSSCQTLEEHFRGKLLVLSTVLPGAARDIIQPIVGNEIEVYSCPVWIALGSVVRDLQNPPAIVIGNDGPGNGIPVLRLLNTITNGSVLPKNVTITDTRTAEMMKLIHNAWCTTKMAFISELGGVAFESFNIDAVSNFMANGGERPGAFWRFGPSFGGPCFPRDLNYFIAETGSDLAKTVLDMNYQRTTEIVAELLNEIDPNRAIILLGKSYKYGVAVDEGSVYLDIAEMLEMSGRSGEILAVDSLEGVNTAGSFIVLCHKELESSIPEDVQYMDLWEVDQEETSDE